MGQGSAAYMFVLVIIENVFSCLKLILCLNKLNVGSIIKYFSDEFSSRNLRTIIRNDLSLYQIADIHGIESCLKSTRSALDIVFTQLGEISPNYFFTLQNRNEN